MWAPFRRAARSRPRPRDSVSDGGGGEIGHALSSWSSRAGEDNWELRFPESVRTFAKMGREDAQVTSVLNALRLPIARADWRLDPNGAPPEVVAHVAGDLRLQVRGEDPTEPVARRQGRVSWSEHLEQALLALQFGVMFFEQVYAPGPDGRLHLRKLAPRYPGTISRVNVAVDGGLDSVEQQAATVGNSRAAATTIPVSRLVAYCHAPRDSSWTGTSVLRPAFKHWKLRDQFLRLEAQVLERNGMGVPIYEGSALTNDPDGDLARGLKTATDLRSGAAAGAAVPAGAKLHIQGVSGQLVSAREAITYHDSMMARAVLAHFLNLEGKGGSYALAQTQSDLFVQSLQTIADWVADTATQHVVEDLVNLAFPEYDGVAPRIVVDPIASRKELGAESLATLARDGVVQPDKDLEEHIRRVYSMPPKRPLRDAVADGSTRSPEDPAAGADPAELAQLAAAVKALMEAGMSREDALRVTGLDNRVDELDNGGTEPVPPPTEGTPDD